MNLQTLKEATRLTEKYHRDMAKLGIHLNGSNGSTPTKVRKPMSQAMRNKIAAAQRKRWRELRKAATK